MTALTGSHFRVPSDFTHFPAPMLFHQDLKSQEMQHSSKDLGLSPRPWLREDVSVLGSTSENAQKRAKGTLLKGILGGITQAMRMDRVQPNTKVSCAPFHLIL